MLATLKARLKELTGQIDGFLKKETLTAEEMAALDAATTEVEAVEGQIKSLERAESARARSAQPADAPVVVDPAAPAQVAIKLTTSEKVGLMVAAMAKSHLEGEGKGPRATFKCLEDNGFGHVAKEFATTQRALNSGAAAAGGVLLPETMSSEIIDILRPNTTFIQGGPRRVPMVNGSYKMPAAASGASAAWRGEGEAAAVTQATFKEINMQSHFLDALVPITNQLIRFSLPDVRAWVEMDLSLEMGTEIDTAAYRGAGTAHTPLGITKIPGVTSNAATATGTSPAIALIEADAATAELGMMNANLPMLGAKWVMSPRTFIHLQNMRDANGNRYYPELQNANPTWRNKPVLVTTQNPVNLGATTDETEIWLVAFGHVLFGEGLGITFSVSTEATYVKSGTTVSAFQNDLTLIKASAEADFDMRYLEAVSVITGVRWGA